MDIRRAPLHPPAPEMDYHQPLHRQLSANELCGSAFLFGGLSYFPSLVEHSRSVGSWPSCSQSLTCSTLWDMDCTTCCRVLGLKFVACCHWMQFALVLLSVRGAKADLKKLVDSGLIPLALMGCSSLVLSVRRLSFDVLMLYNKAVQVHCSSLSNKHTCTHSQTLLSMILCVCGAGIRIARAHTASSAFRVSSQLVGGLSANHSRHDCLIYVPGCEFPYSCLVHDHVYMYSWPCAWPCTCACACGCLCACLSSEEVSECVCACAFP